MKSTIGTAAFLGFLGMSLSACRGGAAHLAAGPRSADDEPRSWSCCFTTTGILPCPVRAVPVDGGVLSMRACRGGT